MPLPSDWIALRTGDSPATADALNRYSHLPLRSPLPRAGLARTRRHIALPALRDTPAIPPLQPTRAAMLQPLRDDDGQAAICPICLQQLSDEDNQRAFRNVSDYIRNPQSSEVDVRWTRCCGRAFHASCLAGLQARGQRCPICRCESLRAECGASRFLWRRTVPTPVDQHSARLSMSRACTARDPGEQI